MHRYPCAPAWLVRLADIASRLHALTASVCNKLERWQQRNIHDLARYGNITNLVRRPVEALHGRSSVAGLERRRAAFRVETPS